MLAENGAPPRKDITPNEPLVGLRAATSPIDCRLSGVKGCPVSDLTTDHPDFARAYPFLSEPINFLRTLFVPIVPH
jgi:hypothetical protein